MLYHFFVTQVPRPMWRLSGFEERTSVHITGSQKKNSRFGNAIYLFWVWNQNRGGTHLGNISRPMFSRISAKSSLRHFEWRWLHRQKRTPVYVVEKITGDFQLNGDFLHTRNFLHTGDHRFLKFIGWENHLYPCLLYTSPSPRD